MTDELTAHHDKLDALCWTQDRAIDALQQRLNALTLTLAEIRTILGLPLVPPHVIGENVLSALRQTLQAKDSVIRSLTARCKSQSETIRRLSQKANV